MRSTTLFYRTMNFLIAIFFVLFGTLAFLLPWIAHLRLSAIEFLLGNSIAMTFIGLGFIMVGVVMLMSVLGRRREYYHLRTGDRAVLIDEDLFNSYVRDYWQRTFPDQEFSSQVKVRNNRIIIVADLPPLPFEDQRNFLKTVEQDLSDLFATTFEYKHSFSLSISFQETNSPLSYN